MKTFLCLAALLLVAADVQAGPLLDRIRENREARRAEKCQECEATSTPATSVPAARSPVVSAAPATLASPCANGVCPSPAKSFRIFRR